MAKAIFIFLLCVITIPLVGLLTSMGFEAHYGGESDEMDFLKGLSILSCVVALLIPIVYFIAANALGRSRALLAHLFPWIMRATMLLLAASVIAQSVIFIMTIWYGESALFGRVHIGLIAVVGIGAVFASGVIITQVFSIGRRITMQIHAAEISLQSAPEIWKFVQSIAKQLHAQMPTNILIGLEPNFYATNARIAVIGEKRNDLRGETLYLSAPLIRLLSIDELKSVIGHELGHFSGKDTLYTMKFAPVYAGLAKTTNSLTVNDKSGASAIAIIPAYATVILMLEIFSRVESRISRDRELEADSIGASVGNSRAVISAIIKTALAAPHWQEVRQLNINTLKEDKYYKNLSGLYAQYILNLAEKGELANVANNLGNFILPHPTDSHPTLATRASALKVDLQETVRSVLAGFHEVSPPFETELSSIEEIITLNEHRLMYALGIVKPKEDKTGAK